MVPVHESVNTDGLTSHVDTTQKDAGLNSVSVMLAIESAATPAAVDAKKKAGCGFCGEVKEKLLLCGKCKIVRYCNADHQRQHWFDRIKRCV